MFSIKGNEGALFVVAVVILMAIAFFYRMAVSA